MANDFSARQPRRKYCQFCKDVYKRQLRERRGSYVKMVIISALVAVICSRLRGTVGALGFSISTGLVIWGAVDAVMLTNQIKVLDKRAMDMMRARDAAAKIAAEAQEL